MEKFSTTPAKLFGLFPRKGTIAVGSDADIVVFDPDVETVIIAHIHQVTVDGNLYEAMALKGVPEVVIANGRVLMVGGKYLGTPAGGRFLKGGSQLADETSAAKEGDLQMVGAIFPDRPPLRERNELVQYPEQRGFRIGLGLRDSAGTGRFNPLWRLSLRQPAASGWRPGRSCSASTIIAGCVD